MDFGRFCAVEYQTSENSDVRGPILVGMSDDGRAYTWHSYGVTPFTMPQMTILAEYARSDFKSVADIQARFEQDFPPIPRVIQSAGWLAPDGKFYPCRYYEHDILAERLSEIYYGSRCGTQMLDGHGWLRIDSTGVIKNRFHVDDITQTQIDTLSNLCFHADGEYCRHLAVELDNILGAL